MADIVRLTPTVSRELTAEINLLSTLNVFLTLIIAHALHPSELVVVIIINSFKV